MSILSSKLLSRALVTCCVILVPFSYSFADTFSPTLLRFNAPDLLQYDFDGSNLEIPFTVSGTPAQIVFCVFTKVRANEISETINGYLGRHHVNKVDFEFNTLFIGGTITVNATAENDKIHMLIKDDGMGIESSELVNIFKEFY